MDEQLSPNYVPQDRVISQGEMSLLAATLNPTPILIEVEHKLNGERYNTDTEKWESIRDPLANKKGIGSILLKLSLTFNQNTILSNLTDKEVSSFMRELAEQVDLFLARHYYEFGIRKSELSFCADAILDPTYFALKRCMGAGERGLLRNTLQQTERVQVTQQQTNKPGLLSRFLGGRE